VIDKFKKAKNEESSDNWLVCWTGQDGEGNHFNVTTNFVQASSLYNYTRGAEGDAELIARLLNWYYSDRNTPPNKCLRHVYQMDIETWKKNTDNRRLAK